ncbi:DUF7260 family protein [Halorussus marinus]|uniref:DUF7260 family protein n=1 Tax=Halorussus marinus TaxID=2505976 RepID=UPI00106EAA57|nr:hypothetical protein [Halorussus marinus]
MTVELRTHAARDRAAAESDRIERKVAAFESFERRVRDVSAEAAGRAGSSAPAGPSTGGALAVGTPTDGAATDPVREAFEETVLALADADATAEAMADELSPDLAAALSPAGAGFAPGLKTRLLERVGERQSECRLLADAVAAERDRLGALGDDLDDVTAWLAEADETSLLELGFEELRARHDQLAAHRETCDELARERQRSLDDIRYGGAIGIREREVLDLLYADFPVDHPVLADIAALDSLLDDCQRAVRRHLCARV